MNKKKLTAKQVRLIRGDDSQAALAKKLRCGVVAVSRWENGHHAPMLVHAEKLHRIAQQKGIEL